MAHSMPVCRTGLSVLGSGVRPSAARRPINHFSNTTNAVMETAGQLHSPVIIQFSTSGAASVGGKNVPVDSTRASVLGATPGRDTSELTPTIRRDGQRYVRETYNTDSERPINYLTG